MLLADLRHNYGGVLSTDCMPLGVGYMKAVIDRDLAGRGVASSVHAYPDELLEALGQGRPDVVMLSNYVWNEALSLAFLRHARRVHPEVVAVLGGPNIPFEPERQLEFVAAHPEIDVYALGEGDFLAAEIVRRWLDAGRSRAALLEQPLPSCIVRRPDGLLVRTEQAERNRDVNAIPSPWLTGVMDRFFDDKLAPILETNRGCPFQCSFCVQGTGFYTRITSFDMERLRAEIDFVGRAIHERSPAVGTLRIADANYGMYPRDTEISGYIAESQKRWRYPRFIDATTGKNRADRILESMEKVNGALMLYQAVQSLDEEVLRNIRRSNIRVEEYEKMQVHIRGRGLRSVSDLILGLPGETLTSHLAALHKLIDAGTHSAHCFQSMMLKGAELETAESRAKWGFRTAFRVLPKNFGIYAGEKVFDIEEIVVATGTLPFEDYLECRRHHLAFSVFWNDSWFREVVEAAGALAGVRPSEWLCAMLEALKAAGGPAGALLDEFVDETRHELFPTRAACAEFYARDENFTRLCHGEIGDNLMYKYRALASFFRWKELCACAMDATRELLRGRGVHERVDGFDALWDDVHRWVQARHADGRSAEEITRPVACALAHDVPRWLADGAPADVGRYRFERPLTHVFALSDEGEDELRRALQVWTSKLTGLSKLVTRIRVASQVRACRVADAAPAAR